MCLFSFVHLEAPPEYQALGTAAPGYSECLQPLNGKLTPHSHLAVSNGAQTSAVLNGASNTLRYTPYANAPSPNTPAPANQ